MTKDTASWIMVVVLGSNWPFSVVDSKKASYDVFWASGNMEPPLRTVRSMAPHGCRVSALILRRAAHMLPAVFAQAGIALIRTHRIELCLYSCTPVSSRSAPRVHTVAATCSHMCFSHNPSFPPNAGDLSHGTRPDRRSSSRAFPMRDHDR